MNVLSTGGKNLVESCGIIYVDVLISIEFYERTYLISKYWEGEVLNLVKFLKFLVDVSV